MDHAPGGNTETEEEANDGSSRTSGDADGREEGTVDAKSSASAKADESPAGEGTTDVSMEEGAADAATEADTTESRGSGAGGIHGATESRERKSAMLNREAILTKSGDLAHDTLTMGLNSKDARQSLAVGLHDERTINEVRTKMKDGRVESEQLAIKSAITTLRLGEAERIEGSRTLYAVDQKKEDRTTTVGRGVAGQERGKVPTRMNEDRVRRENITGAAKGRILSRAPNERDTLPQKLIEGLSKGAEIWNKSAVETQCRNDALHLSHRSGNRDFAHGMDLLRDGADAVSGNAVSEEVDNITSKANLLPLNLDPLRTHAYEVQAREREHILKGRGVETAIVDERDETRIPDVIEDITREGGNEGKTTILEAKGNTKHLKNPTSGCLKSQQLGIRRTKPDLHVAHREVENGEVPRIGKIHKQIIRTGKREADGINDTRVD